MKQVNFRIEKDIDSDSYGKQWIHKSLKTQDRVKLVLELKFTKKTKNNQKMKSFFPIIDSQEKLTQNDRSNLTIKRLIEI